MDRREFVKMLGAGGALVALGALMGSGCAEEEEPTTELEEEPPVDPDAPEGGEEPEDAEPAG